jgi:hypothetical protein
VDGSSRDGDVQSSVGNMHLSNVAANPSDSPRPRIAFFPSPQPKSITLLPVRPSAKCSSASNTSDAGLSPQSEAVAAYALSYPASLPYATNPPSAMPRAIPAQPAVVVQFQPGTFPQKRF